MIRFILSSTNVIKNNTFSSILFIKDFKIKGNFFVLFLRNVFLCTKNYTFVKFSNGRNIMPHFEF